MGKRGVQTSFIALSIIFLSSLVLAQTSSSETFDADKAFNWLVAQSSNGNYGEIRTTAFAALALKDAGARAHADVALAWIKGQEDTTNHCWPSSSCKPLDTAFALWALNDFGEQTVEGEDWLRSSLTAALKNNWWLQVITTENGTCRVSYMLNSNSEEEDIAVNAGVFPTCTATPTQTFFDLNTCLQKKNVVANNPSTAFDVNCNNLGPSTIISVVFNSGTEYTLVEQATTGRYVVTINNGCFGDSSRGSCSKDASLYANWILEELQSATNVDSWLLSNYDNLKAFDNALMYLASDSEQMFIDDLLALQRNDGSFNKDVIETSLAILALKAAGNTQEATAATEFLKTKQQSDGSWEGSTLKTAMALYSAFSSATIALAPLPGLGPPTGGAVCGDLLCEPPETELTCPKDCPGTTAACDNNGICETGFGENTNNCPSDCTCGDNVCDSIEQSSGLCTADCGVSPGTGFGAEICGNDLVEGFEECDGSDDTACPSVCQADCTCGERKRGLGWLWITIVVLLLGLAAYFFYSKYHQGGKRPAGRRPEFKPFTSQLQGQRNEMPKIPYKPVQPVARSSKVEDELEKSIREAKKLIKKL